MTNLFRTDDGSLRLPWRVVVFFVLCIGCSLVAGALLPPLIVPIYRALGIYGTRVDQWVALAGMLGGTALMVKQVDRAEWRSILMHRDAAGARPLVEGLLVGAFAIAAPIALLVAVGWLDRVSGPPGSQSGAFGRVVLVLLPAALSEELFARGYLFAAIRKAWGATWALVITSVAFSIIHVFNPGATWSSLMLVALAGAFLGGVLLATNSLYAAWLAHFAWNAVMALGFHTPVSGQLLESPGYRFVDDGPDWITGGQWGPEGGLAAGVGMILTGAYLYSRHRSTRNRPKES